MNFSQNLIENKIYNFNKWGANFTGSGSKENNSEYNWTVDNILSYKKTSSESMQSMPLSYMEWKKKTVRDDKGRSNQLL